MRRCNDSNDSTNYFKYKEKKKKIGKLHALVMGDFVLANINREFEYFGLNLIANLKGLGIV